MTLALVAGAIALPAAPAHAADPITAAEQPYFAYYHLDQARAKGYTGEGVTKRDIAVALRADLPGFMVPRKIEQLEAMPRLDNGKTNMRALAERITAAAKH